MKFSYLRVGDYIIIWKNAIINLHFKWLKILKKELKPKWENMAMNNKKSRFEKEPNSMIKNENYNIWN